MSVIYVDTPSRPQAKPVIIPPPPRKQIPVSLIWIIAIILIVLIIIIFAVASTRLTRSTIEVPSTEKIYNLDTLTNLDPNGVCCHLPASATVTDRYIYLPDTDRTYSLTPSNVSAVCQGLTGQQLVDCQTEVADSSNQLKIVSHRGIKIYYTFALGQAPSTVCQNFEACPLV